jgi:hypothetical protein
MNFGKIIQRHYKKRKCLKTRQPLQYDGRGEGR